MRLDDTARERGEESDEEFAARLMSSVDTNVDTEAALRRLRQRAATTVAPKPRMMDRWRARMELASPRALRPLAVAAILTTAAAALFISGTAENMVKVFEPKQVTAVPVNTNGLGSLPDLAAYGTVQTVKKPDFRTGSDWSTVAGQTGLHLLVPSQLPSDVKGQASFYSVGSGTASFTFSKSKALLTLRGNSLPQLPSAIDGSTLLLQFGPAAAEVVGEPSAHVSKSDNEMQSLLSGIPKLVIVEMSAPVVSSTGVSVKQLEDALVSMPGISPDLAASIRAIGDPSTTLPIPIPSNLAVSRQVSIQGVHGVLIGDSTGIGSGVVWAKGGMVYAVAGTISDNEVMSIAGSLH